MKMQTAINILPQLPTCEVNATCVSAIPVSPLFSCSPEIKIINAVALHITIVSRKTPNTCTIPCLTGWLTSAVAAAFGALPIPASFENNPLLIPIIIAAPIPPPVNCFNPKAP